MIFKYKCFLSHSMFHLYARQGNLVCTLIKTSSSNFQQVCPCWRGGGGGGGAKNHKGAPVGKLGQKKKHPKKKNLGVPPG
jgi:hypothetical protein